MASLRAVVVLTVTGCLLFAAPVAADPGGGRPATLATPAASTVVTHPDLWYLGDQAALFDEALGLAGLTVQTFRLEPDVVSLWGGDRYRLPLFDLFYRDAWTISPYTRDLARGMIAGAGSVTGITASAQAAAGIRVRDNFYSSFLTGIVRVVDADSVMALARAIETLGGGNAEEIARRPGYDAIPSEVARSAAILLYASAQAFRLRDLALSGPLQRLGLDPDSVYAEMHRQLFWDTRADDDDNPDPELELVMIGEMLRQERILDAVDFPLLYKGANIVALAVDWAMAECDGTHAREAAIARAREEAAKDSAGVVIDAAALEAAIATLNAASWDPRDRLAGATFRFAARTDRGWVRLGGSGDDTYDGREGADLVVIDTGGDDTWRRGGATPDYRHGVSVAIDLSGDDAWVSADAAGWEESNARIDGRSPEFRHHRPEDHPVAIAAGICGYGFVVDLGGDDRYAMPFAGLGAGVLGQGVLLDRVGNDRYTGDSGVEGSGTFGVGVLVDLDGDDLYHCFCKSQGYGYTKGCGLLVDVAGVDRYIAETGNVKYRWFGTHPKQLNLSQGFGYGRRADMGDGHSWAGGVGILADGGEGNDIYEADIFALGSSYWYALGILYDAGGDDRYRSHAYSIAAPPHFAVGVVLDEAGDDEYIGHSSRACGFGRDFSIGWFEDGSGNDRYYVNDSALGAGNINSLGVFWDKSGDDLYVARSNSFGRPSMEASGNRRDLIRNAGLFVDGGGRDRYRQFPLGMTDAEHEAFDWAQADTLLPMDDFRDGARLSWRDLLVQPGSTGAAVDAR